MEDYIFGGILGTTTALIILAVIKKRKKKKILKNSIREIKVIEV